MGKIFLAEIPTDEAEVLTKKLRDLGVEDEIVTSKSPVQDPSILDADIEILSVFVASKVGVAELDACIKLKLIATRSTGFDHIDSIECKKRGITVATVPTYGENTVAEHVFALILSLSRNVHKAWTRTKNNDFSLDGLRGFDLRGKTIGLIGTGRIGLHTAKIARGFGMRVLAYDIKPQALLAEVIGFEYCDLDYLVKESDIVTLHAPLIPATKHLVNKDLLSKFKKNSLLINTARGGLVDTQALLWALDENILAGAGLDVLESETMLSEDGRMLLRSGSEDHLRAWVQNRTLIERENVVVTPHIGFDSQEAVERILDTTALNIATFLSGKPENTV